MRLLALFVLVYSLHSNAKFEACASAFEKLPIQNFYYLITHREEGYVYFLVMDTKTYKYSLMLSRDSDEKGILYPLPADKTPEVTFKDGKATVTHHDGRVEIIDMATGHH